MNKEVYIEKSNFYKWFLIERLKFANVIVDSDKGSNPEFNIDGDSGVLQWHDYSMSAYETSGKIELPLKLWCSFMNEYFDYIGYNGECLDLYKYDNFYLFKALILNRPINGIFEKLD